MEPDEQWALVKKYRLELERDADKVFWGEIEADWQCLNIAHDPYLKREDANFASRVLPSIVSWIENIGTYPPPELLLALCDMFKQYMNGAGNLTLENALLGKPRQRMGTYAAREAKRDVHIEVGFTLAFHSGKHRGMSDARAAEYAQAVLERKYGESPDAETMLKRMRRRNTRTK